MEKYFLSADDFLRDAWRLAAQVKASGWQPDILIALWRGGATPGIVLHEFFKVSGWDVKHVPLKCASYEGIGASTGKVQFQSGEEIFGALKPGMRVLVVDDVFDTGTTAQAMHTRLAALDVEMKMACVYWKSLCNRTAHAPDYFVRDLKDQWIVFPHELDGLTPEERRQKDPLLVALCQN